MGSRLFSEIREQRGLCYSVSAFGFSHSDVPGLQLSSGLDSEKCVEAYVRMREIVSELREDGPTEEEVDRAKAYTAGARVLAFERTGTVASHAASQAIVRGEAVDPDAAIEALDSVTFEEVVEVASGIGVSPAVACVGPHDAADFESNA
jgi:predicted Zn-dependent peptidase